MRVSLLKIMKKSEKDTQRRTYVIVLGLPQPDKGRSEFILSGRKLSRNFHLSY